MLFYLLNERVVQLLDEVTDLAASGSWMGFDIVNSAYALTFQPDHEQIAEVTQAHRIQTPFRSPQLDLWRLSDTEWLLALCRPDLPPRQNRGKLVALARQLPLPDWSATG